MVVSVVHKYQMFVMSYFYITYTLISEIGTQLHYLHSLTPIKYYCNQMAVTLVLCRFFFLILSVVDTV